MAMPPPRTTTVWYAVSALLQLCDGWARTLQSVLREHSGHGGRHHQEARMRAARPQPATVHRPILLYVLGTFPAEPCSG
jgi:hypothetical protein